MLNKNKNLIDIIIEKIKHPQVWGSFVALIIMIIISFAYFHPDVVQGRVLQQFDMMQGTAIGQEAKAFEEATGEKSMWTNSVFSGMPTFQISPSYSSNSLFEWINSLYGAFLPVPANLLVMMMLGFFILLLAFGMKWWQALIGAIAYGFSSYFIILIGAGHIWKYITLAYIPPTIAGIVLCYKGRYLLGGALAALFAMMQLSANHVQMTYYFTFVIVGFVIAYLISAIKEKKFKQWSIATCTLAVAAILAVAANSPSLYNTYEYSKETMRGKHSELTAKENTKASANKTDGLDRDYITHYSYGGAETFTLLIPDVKGGSSQHSLAEADAAKDFSYENQQILNQLPQYFGGAEGTSGPVYVGAIICALFLLGCIIVKGPIKWTLIVLTLLSILLALGRNFMWFTDLFIDLVPMYSKFRTVESILVIAQFTMPLLALLAVKQLFEEKEPWKKYKNPIIISFGLTLFICLLGIIAPSIFGSFIGEAETEIKLQYPQIFAVVEQVRAAMVSSDCLRSFMFIAFAFGVILFFCLKKIPAKISGAVLCILVLIDLFSVGKRYLNHDNFHDKPLLEYNAFEENEIDKQILADTTSHYRVMNIPMFEHPAPSYHHKTIGGYHAAKLTRYQDLIDRQLRPIQQYNYISELRSDSIKITDKEKELATLLRQKYRILDMLNARYIITHEGSLIKNPHALGNAWFVDNVVYAKNADEEMNALDSINPATTAVADMKFKNILGTAIPKSAGDTISLTSYAPNRLTYHAKSVKGGVAVFSEVYFPWGWNVTIDGKPVELARVNYVLRALNIPAGNHKIEMYFNPQSIHTTTTMASVAVILIYLALIVAVVFTLLKPQNKKEVEKTAL